MKRLKPYILPVATLLVIIIITIVLFLVLNFLPELEKKLTAIISILAISFGVFQFWVAEINNRIRRIGELRFNEYKEIFVSLESVADIINREMVNHKTIDIHGLVSTILNQINRTSALVNINKDFLFPELTFSEESKDLNEILGNILKRTDKLRIQIEKAVDKDKKPDELAIRIHTMNWNNDVNEYLDAFHEAKYKFYAKLQEYLNRKG